MSPRPTALPVAFLAALLLLLPACGGGGGGANPTTPPTNPDMREPHTGTVFLWLGADMDAHVSCGRPGDGCPEGNTNYGLHGTLPVAGSILAIKRIYVHFSMPTFPAGSVLEEAWFEMFHPGTREDGMTDDVKIPVTIAAGPWLPRTITWNNQPNANTAGSISTIKLNSAEWSSTGNIRQTVGGWINDPDSNYGLVTFWNTNMNPGIEKGFYSINDIRRRLDDMGPTPRLLMRVRLPDGATSNDIVLPPFLAPGHDLPTQPGQPITMLEVSPGEGGNFPSAWRVRRGN